MNITAPFKRHLICSGGVRLKNDAVSITSACVFVKRYFRGVFFIWTAGNVGANANRTSKCDGALTSRNTESERAESCIVEHSIVCLQWEADLDHDARELNSSNIYFLPRCLPGQEVCLCALESAEVCGKRGRKRAWVTYVWLCVPVCPHPSK